MKHFLLNKSRYVSWCGSTGAAGFPLPTYAPFLNPQKKIWLKMRRYVSHNHPFITIAEVEEQFHYWVRKETQPEKLLTVISFFKE